MNATENPVYQPRLEDARVHVDRPMWAMRERVHLYMRERLPGDRIGIMRAAEWVSLPPDDPTLHYECAANRIEITEAMAQQLMDGLWHCGFRPAAGHGSAGQLAATERHLEDLRSLVFKSLPPRGAKAD